MALGEVLAENAILKANLEALTFQLEQLKHLIFGAKRETLNLTVEQARFPFDTNAPEPVVTLPEVVVLIPTKN